MQRRCALLPPRSDRLTELRRAILEAQQEALEPGRVYPAAFATFRTRTSQASGRAGAAGWSAARHGGACPAACPAGAAPLLLAAARPPSLGTALHSLPRLQVVAARTLMSEDLSTWRCQGAPRAEEIVWQNLGFRVWERTGEGPGEPACGVWGRHAGCPGMPPLLV